MNHSTRTAAALRRARRAAPLVTFLALLAPSSARAQPAAAQALYDQATKAMDRGDYGAACPKLEQVVTMAPEGIGARKTLGQCYEASGRLASAWSAFSAAHAIAARQGDGRAAELQAKVDALGPRLAHLQVIVQPGDRALAGLSIRLDGAPVGAAAIDAKLPVDRGAHQLSVSAAGKETWTRPFDVPADGATVTVTVDALKDGPGEGGGPNGAGARRTSPLVYIGFGAAGAGLIVGTITGILTFSAASKCTSPSGCDQGTLNGGRATAVASDIAFGVAAAGAAVGVVGLFIKPKSSAPSAVRLFVSPRAVALTTSF